MAIKTIFARRRKGPSPAFVLVIAITAVGLALSYGLPRLVMPRFANQPISLVLQVRVIDDQGAPIPGAKVSVGRTSGETDADGYVNVRQIFPGEGIMGISGTCAIKGEMRVEASGFPAWQGFLSKLFGENHNYVEKGTTLPCEIVLRR